jgi:LuxR family transcriptional regulator, maltose regulon positive regulatory protein
VTPATAAALTAATGGWAVALRLAAGCLRRGAAPERLAAAVADDDGSPVQYLTARLLGDQPAESRRLHLRTSVTAELWPELVARLTGDLADGRIAGLAHAGAFAEDAPAAPGGYQIHPLPRELLAAQLRLERPYTITALHWICAAWFAGAGRLPEAVAHATSADGLPARVVLRLTGLDEFLTSHRWTELSLTTARCQQLIAALDDVPAR